MRSFWRLQKKRFGIKLTMNKIGEAAKELKAGRFILVHDSEKREDETDMVILSEHVGPEHLSKMRIDAGGLICVAIGRSLSEKICLPLMADVLIEAENKFPLLKEVRGEDIKYDKKSAFSLTVNHRKTFTGVSDIDRALTIKELGLLCRDIAGEKNPAKTFGARFRSPGHISLLASSGLENRQGHTELTTAISEMCGLTQCVVVCEMMDEKTHKSLTLGDARKYAGKNKLTLIEGKDILQAFKQWRR
jgi:3,4-dihydroxy 2-butanone 4-phosphate synthase